MRLMYIFSVSTVSFAYTRQIDMAKKGGNFTSYEKELLKVELLDPNYCEPLETVVDSDASIQELGMNFSPHLT